MIVVIELSQSSWLVAARAPGLARDPLKKLAPDPGTAVQIDRPLARGVAAGRTRGAAGLGGFRGGGRDGFWLARLLAQHEIEAYVIHPTSIPVKRDHRRAKTDRLDTELLMRAFLGWLRGEADHCAAQVRRAGAGLERTPEAPPGARHHANFPLDKKDPIQGAGVSSRNV
ncbi:MAG: hypothetical protein WAV18_17525 [Roseiarcus sp.]